MPRWKRWLSNLEVGLGIVFFVFSVYSVISRYRCPERAVDCGGWEMMGAWIGFMIASGFICSGVLLREVGIKSWLGHLLIVYSIALVCLIS